MKKYYNDTTGEWYTEGNSITKYIDGELCLINNNKLRYGNTT